MSDGEPSCEANQPARLAQVGESISHGTVTRHVDQLPRMAETSRGARPQKIIWVFTVCSCHRVSDYALLRAFMKRWFPLGPVLVTGWCAALVPCNAEPPTVPPPVPEIRTSLPQPPPLAPQTAALSRVEIEKLTPQVEIWSDGSNTPQRPMRRRHLLDWIYVSGDRPVVVRLQFDRSASGKIIGVRGVNNVSLQTSEAVLRVRPTGECVVALLLDPAATRGHITFICEGFETTMPMVRSTAAVVAAREDAAAKGRR